MKKLYKVFGILFSVVIIASIFLPYVKVDNMSLFTVYKNNDQIVLPIVLMLFGVGSLVLYLLNFYIEFSLSTGGALLFYLITEVISIINQDAFSEVNYGFYLLIGGSVGLIITTVLYILSSKKESKEESNDYSSSYEQPINNTYSNNLIEQPVQSMYQQPVVEPVAPVQPVMDESPIIEPVVSVQPQPVVETVAPVQSVQSVAPVQPVQSMYQQPVVEPVAPVQPVIEPVAPVQSVVEPVAPVQPIYQQPVVTPQPVIPEPITELKPIEDSVVIPLTERNPLPDLQFEPIAEVVEESKPIYEAPKEAPLNPVLQQFEIPTSFLNSGRPQVSSAPEEIATNNNEPTIGMDIFNNH